MTPPLTPETLAELRRLHAAATPGPWGVDDGIVVDDRGNAHKVDPATIPAVGIEVDHVSGFDASLIVAARNALPALLDAAEERDRLLVERDRCCDDFQKEAQRATAAEELIAAHRAELCLAFDVIDALPESALEGIDEAKLLKLMRCMDDEQKRAAIRDKMDELVTERDRLRALLVRSAGFYVEHRAFCAIQPEGHGCNCGRDELAAAINEATKED